MYPIVLRKAVLVSNIIIEFTVRRKLAHIITKQKFAIQPQHHSLYGTLKEILPFHVLGTGLSSVQWIAFTISR